MSAKNGMPNARSTKCTAPASSAPGRISSDGMICAANARIAFASAGVRATNPSPLRASSRAQPANDASHGMLSASQLAVATRAESAMKPRRVKEASSTRSKRAFHERADIQGTSNSGRSPGGRGSRS
jgi:hypothetical protein